MRRSILRILCAGVCAALLSGCAAVPLDAAGSTGAESAAVSGPDGATLVCRIVELRADDSLLLAGYGEDADGEAAVYTVPVRDLSVTYEDPEDAAYGLRAGSVAELSYGGTVEETFPARPAQPRALRIRHAGFDDRCRLYREVLEDLWNTDRALNENIHQLGVDLTDTALTPAERSAVSWSFGGGHALVPIQGTFRQLTEEGYLSGMEPDAEEIPAWKDGCLFTLSEQPAPGEDTLCFDAQKWHSALGAYFFADCTARRTQTGAWGDYQVGSEAIS